MSRRRAKRTRNGHKPHAAEVERDRRRAHLVDLHIKGKNFQEIADTLGYGSRQAARADWQRALALARTESDLTLEEARAFELARLAAIDRIAWEHAEAGEMKALEVLLKISDRRSRMLGLDQPVKHEISFDAVEREMARLEAVLTEAGIDPNTIDNDDHDHDDDGGGDGGRPLP